MSFGEKLKSIRLEKNMSQDEFAALLGTSKQVISRYENNLRTPKITVACKYASILNIPTNYLLDDSIPSNPPLSGDMSADDNVPTKYRYIPTQGARLNADYSDDEMVQFPVIGEIAAGFDHSIFEKDTGDYVSIPRSALSGRPVSDYFVLRVKGNSMYPMYLEGDKVLILKTSSVDSGSVAVIQYNGDEASLKKVVYMPGEDWFDMIPINPEYRPKRISGPALLDCNIIGLAKMLIRDIDQGGTQVKKQGTGTINNIIKMAAQGQRKYLKIARGEGGVVEEITDPEQQKAIDRMLNEPYEDLDF